MTAEHPVKTVRKATGKTQAQFAALLGCSRGYIAKIETGPKSAKPFTPELQKKIAEATGAWIPLEKGRRPGAPVAISSVGACYSLPTDTTAPPFSRQSYSKADWEHWQRDLYSVPALRFDEEDNPLCFWLLVLQAAAMRAAKFESVSVAIVHALETIARDHQLTPTINSILTGYSPLFSTLPGQDTMNCSAKWRPHQRPPRWLREAIDIEPIRLHILSPKKPKDDFTKALQRLSADGKREFVTLLKQNPSEAIHWAAKNFPGSHALRSLAEYVADFSRPKAVPAPPEPTKATPSRPHQPRPRRRPP